MCIALHFNVMHFLFTTDNYTALLYIYCLGTTLLTNNVVWLYIAYSIG